MNMGLVASAPPLRGRAIFDQRWCDVTFLHWPVEAEAVARFMPRGVRPDLFDGVTYVGLIPFQMRRAKVGRVVPAPYFGSFSEVNVRLYSVDQQDRHGVVFLSLDASRLAVVAVARLLGVPYRWAAIRADAYPSTAQLPFPALPPGTIRRYHVARRSLRDRPESDLVVKIGEATRPTNVEIFLTARWGMHSSFRGATVWVPNHHESWPLHQADLVHRADGLIAAAGVSVSQPMLRPLWSPGVHAQFGAPES